MTKPLKAHPAADLFPMMGEAELNQLAADIRQRGQLEAIIVTTTGKEDLILDGRNRYEACRRAGVEPYLLTWEDELSPTASATAFVLSKNLHRRHLTESQRAVVAADALPLFEAEAKKRMGAAKTAKGKGAPRGAPLELEASAEKKTLDKLEAVAATKGEQAKKPQRASEAAAKVVGASSRSVERAKKVLAERPELREQLRSAKITLKQAEKQIRKDKELKNALEYRPPVGTYAVIVADVPWQYDDQLDGSDQVRGGTGYPTMPLDEILAIKPPAAPDCALWFWTTNAFLVDGTAAQVVKAWGFEPKALLTWRKVDKDGKDRLGAGHYLRNVTEHCILAVKGKPLVQGGDMPNIFDAPRTSRHSEKPARFFEIAEKVTPCPAAARIELFAVDEERKGWVTSGAEQQAKARSKRRAPVTTFTEKGEPAHTTVETVRDGWEPCPGGFTATIYDDQWFVQPRNGAKSIWEAHRPRQGKYKSAYTVECGPTAEAAMRLAEEEAGGRPGAVARFRCVACGHVQPQWKGKCPECGEWGTVVDAVDAADQPLASDTQRGADLIWREHRGRHDAVGSSTALYVIQKPKTGEGVDLIFTPPDEKKGHFAAGGHFRDVAEAKATANQIERSYLPTPAKPQAKKLTGKPKREKMRMRDVESRS